VEIKNQNPEPIRPNLLIGRAASFDFAKAAVGSVVTAVTEFRLGVPIQKFEVAKNDDGTPRGIFVSGWASVADYEDSQHDIIDAAALTKAMDTWPGNIREMHETKAIGTAKGDGCLIEMREHPTTKTQALWIKALITEPSSIQKVKDGILRAFSIGGRCRKSVIEEIEYDDGEAAPAAQVAA
jgi:hypothetical protein